MDSLRISLLMVFWITMISQSVAGWWIFSFAYWKKQDDVATDLIKIVSTKTYQFELNSSIQTARGKFREEPYWNPEVKLIKTWVNSQEQFYMTCAALEKMGEKTQFEAILYVTQAASDEKDTYKSIGTMEVHGCENMLRAVTIDPNCRKVCKIMYTNEHKECTMTDFHGGTNIHDLSQKKNCPNVNKRSPQRNDNGYTNGWKETEPNSAIRQLPSLAEKTVIRRGNY